MPPAGAAFASSGSLGGVCCSCWCCCSSASPGCSRCIPCRLRIASPLFGGGRWALCCAPLGTGSGGREDSAAAAPLPLRLASAAAAAAAAAATAASGPQGSVAGGLPGISGMPVTGSADNWAGGCEASGGSAMPGAGSPGAAGGGAGGPCITARLYCSTCCAAICCTFCCKRRAGANGTRKRFGQGPGQVRVRDARTQGGPDCTCSQRGSRQRHARLQGWRRHWQPASPRAGAAARRPPAGPSR